MRTITMSVIVAIVSLIVYMSLTGGGVLQEGLCPDRSRASTHHECYFSYSYQEARLRFRDAAPSYVSLPLDGLDVGMYSIDVAILGGHDSKVGVGRDWKWSLYIVFSDKLEKYFVFPF